MATNSMKTQDSSFIIGIVYVLGVLLLIGGNILVFFKRIPVDSWLPGLWFAMGIGLICMSHIFRLRKRISRLESMIEGRVPQDH